MIRRFTLLLLPLLALGMSCAAGLWLVARPPVAPYVVPGATGLRVRDVAPGERLISYDAPGQRYDWYFAVSGGLERARWIPPDKWGAASQINTYTRVSPILGGYAGHVWEQVELHGEPNHARITVRRWVTFPWRQYLDYFR